ncbi:TPA: polysaccharide biosynthesis protein, partial [Campylobacter jejuni]|nr:polysaccharide biosynthesis protein [Campylobacter jejuni]
LSHKIIGIRAGEKLHEIMISSDDSHLTYEFENYYAISPSIKLVDKDNDFSINALGEKGQKVKDGFSYSSDNNPLWTSEKELLEIINHTEGF